MSLRLADAQLLHYFMEKSFPECQFSFITGDSCVPQLLYITHKIYKSYDCTPLFDIKGTFLNLKE